MRKIGLFAVILATIIVTAACSSQTPLGNDTSIDDYLETTRGGLGTIPSETQPNPDESSQNGTDFCAVKFYDQDNNIEKIVYVEKGSDYFPSLVPTWSDEFVFISWDQSLKNITEDIECRPIYENVSNVCNAISFSGVYTSVGDEFDVCVQIGGKPNLACLECQISFDECLAFIGGGDVDGGAVLHCDQDNRVIYIALANGANMNEYIDLCTLKFKVLAYSNRTDLLSIEVTDIASINDSGQGFSAESYEVFKGKITIEEDL